MKFSASNFCRVARRRCSRSTPHLTGLRWLPEEQLHLTLSFLGDLEAPAEDLLCEALREVSPFFLSLRGLGVFNSRGRPSVAWGKRPRCRK